MIRKLCALAIAVLRHPIFAHLIFWLWNGLFMCVAIFGFIPELLVPLYEDARAGRAPFELFGTAVALIAVPFIASAAGLIFLRRRGPALLGLFFGVEAPIFLLALVRMFFVRELTAGVLYVFIVFLVAGAAFAISLFRREQHTGGWLDLIFGTVCVAAGSYMASLLAFYAIPAGAASAHVLLESSFWYEVFTQPIRSAVLFLGVCLGLVSGLFFGAVPLALIALYCRRFFIAAAALRRRAGLARVFAAAAVMLAMLIAGFILSNRQPQRRAFELLESPPATDAERRALLDASEDIRAGLLNAYLAQHRYTVKRGGATHIQEIWREVFECERETAAGVRAIYEHLARPWIYDGEEGREKSAEAYARFFDVPIQKGEREAILHALESTWDRTDREAGLLDEGGRRVHVTRQELSIREHGDWADVELHELHTNRTAEQQEIFYTFSLPGSAAITGLYLGDTAERDRRFPFVVAPRGAAQQVYKSEVQRRVDPALLEQIGPSQYRLRAFPVPPNGVLHLWLEYKVLLDDGTIPLPRLAEQRNVYLDEKTERFIDASPLELDDEAAWLPRSLSAKNAAPAQPHTAVLGPLLAVRAEPLEISRLIPRPGGRYAIVLDRSRSMERRSEELTATFAWLKSTIAPSADLDLYLTSAPSRGEPPIFVEDMSRFDPARALYFGGQNPADMLEQLAELRGDRSYSAIFVLTDGDSYELADDRTRAIDPAAPLWMIHAGGDLPPGYDDATLEAIERHGGGVTTDVRRAFANLALQEKSGAGFLGFEDGYAWYQTAAADEAGEEPGFAPFAARRAIRAATGELAIRRMETLDRIHTLARRFGIVSPYSSMLVLVNDEQRERLAAAERQSDRFDREVETGEERFSSPIGGFSSLTATPEPHEWALLAVGLVLFAALRLRTGLGPRPARQADLLRR